MGRYATTMTHAAESLHWYTRTGEPAYEVRAKAGHNRPTTLADARKLKLVPSVTTIIRCAAAPALEKWKANQLMLAALTLPRLLGEPEKDWLARVATDSKEHARKAADRGTAIHAAIQGRLQNEAIDYAYQKHVDGACAAIDAFFGLDWECCIVEQSFAHRLGFGGKIDLSCTAPEFVVDFKTKEFGPEDELDTYDEHAMQIAAYRHGMEFPKARGAIVYVSVTYPGVARVIEIPQDMLARGWVMFYSLLHYWQAKNTLATSFEEVAA